MDISKQLLETVKAGNAREMKVLSKILIEENKRLKERVAFLEANNTKIFEELGRVLKNLSTLEELIKEG